MAFYDKLKIGHINSLLTMNYRILPIIGTSSNKGAPIIWGCQCCFEILNFLNNGPIFNLKPPLESSEPQTLIHGTRFKLAIIRGCASIRQITVCGRKIWLASIGPVCPITIDSTSSNCRRVTSQLPLSEYLYFAQYNFLQSQ